jgi:hypothetical protein
MYIPCRSKGRLLTTCHFELYKSISPLVEFGRLKFAECVKQTDGVGYN